MPLLLATLVTAAASALLVSSGNDSEAATSIPAWSGVSLLFVAGAIAAWGIWHRSSTEMAVTNKRVSIKIGMVSRNTTEMMLTKIESIGVHQSVIGRMLNFGTIIIRGTGGTPEPFPKIGHPLEFRRQVQQQLDTLQMAAAGDVTV